MVPLLHISVAPRHSGIDTWCHVSRIRLVFYCDKKIRVGKDEKWRERTEGKEASPVGPTRATWRRVSTADWSETTPT
ncbi:hypothetical protein NL676_028458 [Syzygium grande]|nr:hypothetical protein NL676_028458 [Syzygium grande]